MKKGRYGLALFTLSVTAFPVWLPFILWMGYQIVRWPFGHSTAELYENHWDIQIPSEWEEIYYIDSGSSFHGDGERYSIYENVSGGSIWDSSIPFLKGSNDDVLADIQFVMEALAVVEEKQPDFTKPYVWARLSKEGGDYLVILFVPEENMLYLAEYLI